MLYSPGGKKSSARINNRVDKKISPLSYWIARFECVGLSFKMRSHLRRFLRRWSCTKLSKWCTYLSMCIYPLHKFRYAIRLFLSLQSVLYPSLSLNVMTFLSRWVVQLKYASFDMVSYPHTHVTRCHSIQSTARFRLFIYLLHIRARLVENMLEHQVWGLYFFNKYRCWCCCLSVPVSVWMVSVCVFF